MEKLTLRERYLLLWVFKQKRMHHEVEGKYDALNESAVKGMFERLFFGTYKCLAQLKHSLDVECVAFYENKLFSGSLDRRIRVWDTESNELLETLEGHKGTVKVLTLYGNKLISGAYDGTIRLWNADTYEHIATLEGNPKFVRAFALDGSKLYCGGAWDPLITETKRAWDVVTHELISTWGCIKPVSCFALHDNKLYSANGEPGDLGTLVYRLDTEEVEGSHLLNRTDDDNSTTICIVIYGNKLFGGLSDGTIACWPLASNSDDPELLKGHTAYVSCLSLGGHKLYSGSNDETIRVWNADTHEHLAVIRGHSHWVNCLAVQGDRLYSGSVDNSIRVWSIQEEEGRIRTR